MTAKQTTNLLKASLVFAALRQAFIEEGPSFTVEKEDVMAASVLVKMSMNTYINFKVCTV